MSPGLAIVLLALGMPVTAQTPAPTPPDTMAVTPGGVDLRSGKYAVSNVDVSIGNSGAGGLSLTRHILNQVTDAGNAPRAPFGQFSHSWEISVREKTLQPPGSGYNVSVIMNGTSTTFFTLNRTTFQQISLSPDAAVTLQRIASGSQFYYVYRGSDGRIITFLPTATGAASKATNVTLPNGTNYDLLYDGSGRLARVTSNGGYALTLEYNPSGLTNGVSKTCVINRVTTIMPATYACISGAPSSSYAYTNTIMTSITDPANAVWQITSTYTNSTTDFVERFFKPGILSPYLINSYSYDSDYNKMQILRQDFFDGHSYVYGYRRIGVGDPNISSLTIGDSYTDNAGAQTTFEWGSYQVRPDRLPAITSGPTKVTDPINRATLFSYDGTFEKLITRTLPSGMKDTYSYDIYRNITQQKTDPGTGSTLAPLTVSATYDCTYLVSCSKPTTVTDANGNVTTYSYDMTHGGVLTELRAAPASGAPRPVKLYAYAQKFAAVKNASGTLVPLTTGIWVPTMVTECQTVGGGTAPVCDAAALQIVTRYEYGAQGTVNQLQRTGQVVDSGSGKLNLRTCWSYDERGNQQAQTLPRGAIGLSKCPASE